ncbi:diguanylate cyclase domain-containing protein [Acidovorax sp.]|jgi:diguanylate cyclase|uniref:diguanylate cyclase domain-containing protein n=1 Tax=Acidovorax sp. TaxID=1872122 RepID=UPI00391F9EA8
MPPPDTLPAAPAEQAAPMAQALALVATDLRTASQELTELLLQIDNARHLLADLHTELQDAKALAEAGTSQNLVEANAHLVITALQSQADTEQATQELSELSRAAELDGLTQLANRALLHDRFHKAMAHARRHHTRLGLLFIDLDKFKSINDTLGHATGDLVLQQAARCMEASIRDVDTVSRYGGDEFVILLADIAEIADAILVSNKVAAAIAVPMALGTERLVVSASIGVCVYPDDGLRLDDLLVCADAAMYRAKKVKEHESPPLP